MKRCQPWVMVLKARLTATLMRAAGAGKSALVEHRLVEPATAGRPRARACLLFAGRSLRSLAASGLAIRGMQALGLQAVS